MKLADISPIKTQNGTTIKRSKLGVGKDIGGEIYLHRQYEGDVPDQDTLKQAKDVLKKQHPDFSYNALKFGKDGGFTFFNSPDFDEADEPTAGSYIRVMKDGMTKPGATKSIWHHKWLWVKDDYKGFDVAASKQRSRKWLAMPNIDFARIGNKEFWEREVASKLK